jgi:hypothetical protein
MGGLQQLDNEANLDMISNNLYTPDDGGEESKVHFGLLI